MADTLNTVNADKINGNHIKTVETDNPNKQGETFATIKTEHGTRSVRLRDDILSFVEDCNEWGWTIESVTRFVEPVDNKLHDLPMTNSR